IALVAWERGLSASSPWVLVIAVAVLVIYLAATWQSVRLSLPPSRTVARDDSGWVAAIAGVGRFMALAVGVLISADRELWERGLWSAAAVVLYALEPVMRRFVRDNAKPIVDAAEPADRRLAYLPRQDVTGAPARNLWGGALRT